MKGSARPSVGPLPGNSVYDHLSHALGFLTQVEANRVHLGLDLAAAVFHEPASSLLELHCRISASSLAVSERKLALFGGDLVHALELFLVLLQ